jgi:hypothetical protein
MRRPLEEQQQTVRLVLPEQSQAEEVVQQQGHQL